MLKKILAEKKEYVKKIKKLYPERSFSREFSHKVISLKNLLDNSTFSIIPEIKRSSPSAGLLQESLDVRKIAKEYQDNGAVGISVLTCNPFFNGSIEDLKEVRVNVNIPILMKDFIIDESQIYEGRLHGADVILLILRILEDSVFIKLVKYIESLQMDTLVEIHSEADIKRVFNLVNNWDRKIVGINNRNLETLKTDLKTTITLMKSLKRHKITIISESGIKNKEDALLIKSLGVKGILVGEALLKSGDPGENLKDLLR